MTQTNKKKTALYLYFYHRIYYDAILYITMRLHEGTLDVIFVADYMVHVIGIACGCNGNSKTGGIGQRF